MSVEILAGSTAPIVVEAIRPDGTVVGARTTVVALGDPSYLMPWVDWAYEESILTLRISFVGAPNAIVRLNHVTVQWDT